MFLCPHQWDTSKRPGKLGCLVFSLRCFAAHTPSHVSSEVCTFTSTCTCMSNVRSSCHPCTVQPCRKSLRKSFVVHLFERCTVWCSLLVLKMCVPLQLQMHINPGLLDSKGTTPLLLPLVESHCGGFSLCPLF